MRGTSCTGALLCWYCGLAGLVAEAGVTAKLVRRAGTEKDKGSERWCLQVCLGHFMVCTQTDGRLFAQSSQLVQHVKQANLHNRAQQQPGAAQHPHRLRIVWGREEAAWHEWQVGWWVYRTCAARAMLKAWPRLSLTSRHGSSMAPRLPLRATHQRDESVQESEAQ